MVAANWTSDEADVKQHCCISALVEPDFKAADADKADATAQLFPSSPPPHPLAAAAAAAAPPVSLPRKQTESGKLNI